MDTQESLAPEVISEQLQAIRDLLAEHSSITMTEADADAIAKKSIEDILAIRQCLRFYCENEFLTSSIFFFLTHNIHIKKLALLVPWLKKIIVYKIDLIEFTSKLSASENLEKILDRLTTLKQASRYAHEKFWPSCPQN